MSDLETIKSVIQQLQNIRVPVAFMEPIGIPIYNAMIVLNNLCKKEEQNEVEENNGIVFSDIEVSADPPPEESK